MNPYEPNTRAQDAIEASSAAPARRFRWVTVPATLSLLFGVLAIIGLPIGIYQNLDLFCNDTDPMMLSAVIAMPTALLIAGGLNILAGIQWLSRRWLWALVCNAIAYCVIMVAVAMFESAVARAL